jgi:lycopene beta-cyclase
MFDAVIVGGGLAGSLVALEWADTRPNAAVLLLEAGADVGGNHTWSLHESDVSKSQWQRLQPFLTYRWLGHEVAFKWGKRRLAGHYASIASDDFAHCVARRLGQRLRTGATVTGMGPTWAVVDGKRIEARVVVDARGWPVHQSNDCGMQAFVGVEVELKAPHGQEVPLVMDCRVEQLGAFRFVYVLPLSERRLLIEDTYYVDNSRIDVPALEARILSYANIQGWAVETVLRREVGALPIPLNGDRPRTTQPTVGVRAGFFHGTTGYSLAVACAVAERMGSLPFEPATMHAALDGMAEAHWAQQGFFRLLNRMLFRGTTPVERVRIFEAFYQHDEELIARFYAGRLAWRDIAAILARGAPTVPAIRAIRAAAQV